MGYEEINLLVGQLKLSRGTVRLLMSKSIASMRINDYRQKTQKGQITDLEKFKESQKLSGFRGLFHLPHTCLQG